MSSNKNINDALPYYPQSSSWEDTEDQRVTSRKQTFVKTTASTTTEQLPTEKSASYKDSEDFLNLLKKLNQTLESLKYQEQIFDAEKQVFDAAKQR